METLLDFKEAFSQFLEGLRNDEEFLSILIEHPWLKEPKLHLDNILEDPSFFSSMAIFLHSCNIELPDEIFDILGAKRKNIPPLDTWWLEVLFTGVFYVYEERYFSAYDDKITSLRYQLQRMGVIERRKVKINDSKKYQKLLTGSLGKLQSILEITRFEAESLGEDLRLVVLTDYIRKEELPGRNAELNPIERLGAVPIFEFLRRATIPGLKPGILTGSIIIVPVEARSIIEHHARTLHIASDHIRFRTLGYDKQFIRVNIKGEQGHKVVQLITEVFNAGHINTIVGTQALLGEGWDAPSINTLILASNVGSYMLSNQMRGRAIRVNPDHLQKTANIWHLVSLNLDAISRAVEDLFALPESRTDIATFPSRLSYEHLGYDINLIKRRFKAFAGLSYQEPVVIESGFDRLGLKHVRWTQENIDSFNTSTIKRAKSRDQLQASWQHALEGDTRFPRMQKMVTSNTMPARYGFIETLDYMLLNALIGGAALGLEFFDVMGRDFEFRLALLGSLAVAACFTVPQLFRAAYLWIRNGTIDRSIVQVGQALVDTLQYMELIHTPSTNLSVKAEKYEIGLVQCRLDGATDQEQRLFLQALEELLSPIENPPHLIVRESKLGLIKRIDYFAVPSMIGKKTQNAEYFHKKWRKYLGTSTLVHTRTIEGRRILLKARIKSFSAGYERKTDRISVWR